MRTALRTAGAEARTVAARMATAGITSRFILSGLTPDRIDSANRPNHEPSTAPAQMPMPINRQYTGRDPPHDVAGRRADGQPDSDLAPPL